MPEVVVVFGSPLPRLRALPAPAETA